MLNDADLAAACRIDGMEYIIRHGVNRDEIESYETRVLWQQAENALSNLAKHLDIDEELC